PATSSRRRPNNEHVNTIRQPSVCWCNETGQRIEMPIPAPVARSGDRPQQSFGRSATTKGRKLGSRRPLSKDEITERVGRVALPANQSESVESRPAAPIGGAGGGRSFRAGGGFR